jgi:plasmid maintenance system antidote protein VapI
MTERDYAVAPGEWIKEWIEDNKTTPADLATSAGISLGWLRKVLKGEVKLSKVIALRISTVTSPDLRAENLLMYEEKYQADKRRLEIGKAAQEREDQAGTARTAYAIEGVTRRGLRCSDCGATWAACSKKLWEQRYGPCCEQCELEDTHDTISHAEAKQLQEARDAEWEEQKTTQVPARPVARVRPLIRPAALVARRMDPAAKRLKQAHTVPPTKFYTQTYYKIGG